jgi:hypothetical protein
LKTARKLSEDRAKIVGDSNINFTERINLAERRSSTMLFDGVRIHLTANDARGRHQFKITVVS